MSLRVGQFLSSPLLRWTVLLCTITTLILSCWMVAYHSRQDEPDFARYSIPTLTEDPSYTATFVDCVHSNKQAADFYMVLAEAAPQVLQLYSVTYSRKFEVPEQAHIRSLAQNYQAAQRSAYLKLPFKKSVVDNSAFTLMASLANIHSDHIENRINEYGFVSCFLDNIWLAIIGKEGNYKIHSIQYRIDRFATWVIGTLDEYITKSQELVEILERTNDARIELLRDATDLWGDWEQCLEATFGYEGPQSERDIAASKNKLCRPWNTIAMRYVLEHAAEDPFEPV